MSIMLSVSTGLAMGQERIYDVSEVLEKLFDRLGSNYIENDRLRINDSISCVIDSYAASDTVFSHKFTSLRYLGQITSPDSLIKIISWNLIQESGKCRYFCYFIRKQETGKRNRVYRLTATYQVATVKTDTIYTEHDWYGALYYDIKPFISDNNKYWLLLGIDYGNPLISRKIIEVLSFTPEGSITFGRKLFESGKFMKFREVFEYASEAMMSLRFRSDSLVVFDHLVPFSPELKDNHQYYGPDYSFDAYILKDGLWRYNLNVDARNME